MQNQFLKKKTVSHNTNGDSEKNYLTAFLHKFCGIGMLMKQAVFDVAVERDGRFEFRTLYLELILDDSNDVHSLM